MNNDPRIYLAVDNCFAQKRWVRPDDWAKLTRSFDLQYIEASADTELDPYYMEKNYLNDWLKSVKRAEKAYGVKVANIYSGHGSYATLGLAHLDKRVRERMKKEWFMRLVDIAAELEAGLGFFAHAFAECVLNDAALYSDYVKILYDNLYEIAEYANRVGCKAAGVEQMYSPHQIPWRIDETRDMMQYIRKRGADFYFTEDIGHHHIRFVKPTEQQLEQALTEKRNRGVWVGTERAFMIYESALRGELPIPKAVAQIKENMDAHDYLFSAPEDGDCYEWLRQLGCFSPIIHLQQTNGLESVHKFFTPENNAAGKIRPDKLLRAIAQSCAADVPDDMPPRCDELYLTFEAFLGTSCNAHDAIHDYEQSVAYWREFIPSDGLRLSELIKKLDA